MSDDNTTSNEDSNQPQTAGSANESPVSATPAAAPPAAGASNSGAGGSTDAGINAEHSSASTAAGATGEHPSDAAADSPATPTADGKAKADSSAGGADTPEAAGASDDGSGGSSKDDKAASPPQVKVNINALTMLGDGLAGLNTLLLIDGRLEYECTTASDGTLPEFLLTPDCELCVMVRRFDGTLKQVHSMNVPGSDANITLVSPGFVAPAITQPVDGAPSGIDKQAPQFAPGDYGQLKEPTDAVASTSGPSPDSSVHSDASTTVPDATTSAPAAHDDLHSFGDLRVDPPSPPGAAASAPSQGASQPATTANATGQASTPAHPEPSSAAGAHSNAKTSSAKKKRPIAETTPKPPEPTANQPQQPAVGRDENGNPISVFLHKVKDWWGSWHTPTMHLWGGGFVPASAAVLRGPANSPAGGSTASHSTGAASSAHAASASGAAAVASSTASASSTAHGSQASGSHGAGSHGGGVSAHAGARPASAAASASSASQPAAHVATPAQRASSSATVGTARPGTEIRHHQEMVDKLDALFDFCEKQVGYIYSTTAAAVLTQLANGTYRHSGEEKEPTHSLGFCYKYVKVALKYCQIVDSILGGEWGSAGGQPLLDNGFVDVTNRVPDHRWAAAGDVIVYFWSEGTWEARRRKYRNPRLPNYGHIEIRHTEHYYSDFRPLLDLEGKPTLLPTLDHGHPMRDDHNRPVVTVWPEYVNIKIYRKVFDIIPTLRIKAFLRCLRDYECQWESDDSKRYNMLNAPVPGSTALRFESFDKHPWSGIPKSEFPSVASNHSTAAGAYQILEGTWQDIIDTKLIFDEQHWFTPEIQDRMAVIQIEKRKALSLVRKGSIEEAVKKCSDEWTSLPGGPQNSGRHTSDHRPMDMNYFKSLFDKYFAEQKAQNGLEGLNA